MMAVAQRRHDVADGNPETDSLAYGLWRPVPLDCHLQHKYASAKTASDVSSDRSIRL